MEHVQASSRYGTILFFLSVVLLLATAFLNNSFASSADRYESLADWYYRTEDMLGRARSSGLREANFFSALSLQILSSEWFRKTSEEVPSGAGTFGSRRATSLPGFHLMRLAFDPASGDFWVTSRGTGDFDFDEGDPFFQQMKMEVSKFGEMAKEIDHLTVAAERKVQLLDAALAESFLNKDAREILADDFADILVHKKDAARNIRCWIVFGSWSCPGTPTRGVFGGVSYLNRDERLLWPSYLREPHIFTVLGTAKSQDEIDAFLKAEWIKAYNNILEVKMPAAQVSLPGTGLTLTASDFLLLAGPLLIFFQVLFLISKERITTSENDKMAFAFPQFSSPDDPLKPPLATGIAELGERGIWLLFLILPVLILTVAVVTRYDFTPFGMYSGSGYPWLKKIELTRSQDWFSAMLDIVNLGSLGAALIIGVRLTTLHRSSTKSFPDRIHRIMAALALLATSIALIAAGWSLLGTDTEEWRTFFMAFTFIWALGFCTAVIRGAWTMTSISVAGCALGLTILFG